MIVRILLLIWVGWNMLLASVFGKPVIQVQYLEETELPGPKILFSDIAVISGPKEVVENLKNQEVGKTAHFGLTRYLSTHVINTRNLGPLMEDYEIQGMEDRRIKIKTSYSELSRDSVISRIGYFLDGIRSRFDGTAEFDLVRMPATIKAPLDSFNYHVKGSDTFRKKGAQTVLLVIESSNGFHRKIPLDIFIRVFDSVYVADRKISRRVPVTSDMVSLQYRDVTRLRGTPIRKLAELENVLTRQTVVEGRIMTGKLLELPDLIEQGRQVNVVTRSHGITITLEGIARQDGKLGQVIRVKNLATSKMIKARVLDENTVELTSTRG